MDNQCIQDEMTEPQRRNFFNALLFPANTTGLAHIGLFTVCFLLLSGVRRSGLLAVRIAVGFIGLMVSIELVNYLYHCVRESAVGATAAPDSLFADSFDFSGTSFTFGGYFNLTGKFFTMIIPALICFLPAGLYPIFTERFDRVFTLLLVIGTFYFPMFFLAVVIFKSSSGYNPFIHIISIFCTLLPYCLLVFQISFVIGGGIYLIRLFQYSIVGGILLLPIQLYLIMVLMHLLGRFYYLNQSKLNWDA